MRARRHPRTSLATLALVGALLAAEAPATAAGDGQAVLDATAGDVIASAEITPWFGGEVSGTAPDGAVYTLAIPPWSVVRPTTITMRSLTGETDLGPIVAGVAFEPAGTILGVPAALTITGVTAPDTAMAFDFHADAPGAIADVTLGAALADAITMPVRHFSGGVAVDLGKNADQLWDKWIANQDDTSPDGRLSTAETKYAAADAAHKSGRISEETADSIKQAAADEWATAERDRLMEDPKLSSLVEGGRPEDFYALQDELGRILQMKDAAGNDGNVHLEMGDIFLLTGKYYHNLVYNLEHSKAWQKVATSGLTSDLATMTEAISIALGIARQIQLLGGDSVDGLPVLARMAADWRNAYTAQCNQGVPIDVTTILGMEHQLQLLNAGDGGEVAECIRKQLSTPPPLPRVEPIIGRIQYAFSTTYEYGTEVLTATIDVVIVPSPETGQLVFGRGSRMDISQVSPEPPCNKAVKGCVQEPVCPQKVRGVKETGLTIGSASENGGTDGASDSNPDVVGEVRIVRNGALLLRLAIPTVGHGLCRWGGIPIICPQDLGALLGKLERTRPSEWNFSCAQQGEDYFISAGGRLVGG